MSAIDKDDAIKLHGKLLELSSESPEIRPLRPQHLSTCGDCAATEGEMHSLGCDMERCPKCAGQLISCGCFGDDDEQTLKAPLSPAAPEAGRIPFTCKPNLCRRCGRVWPGMFMVKDEDWDKYVPTTLKRELLCRDCYSELRWIFREGWRAAPLNSFVHPLENKP